MNQQNQMSDADRALTILVEAAAFAQSKGAFTLQQASQINWASEYFTNAPVQPVQPADNVPVQSEQQVQPVQLADNEPVATLEKVVDNKDSIELEVDMPEILEEQQ